MGRDVNRVSTGRVWTALRSAPRKAFACGLRTPGPLSIITLKGKRDEAVLQAKVDPNKGRELYFFLVEDLLFNDL